MHIDAETLTAYSSILTEHFDNSKTAGLSESSDTNMTTDDAGH